ncbi:MAG: extracellular solute-binding protein [Microthrixaceae bacterium]|nr:extracellular solute-binding protein [Microthrixaceae bacterium]
MIRSRTTRGPAGTFLALLGALALVAAACGGSDGNGSSGGSGGTEVSASDCPVDALEDADGPVEITVWHAVLGLTADTVEQFAEEYNASQDKVKVTVESQGASYEEQQTKFFAALRDPSTLPTIMLAEDTNTQSMIDSQAAIPASSCIEADPDAGEIYDTLMPAVAKGYTVEDVQWPAAFGVSTPVLYYNKSHFAAAGLDPESPPGTLAEVREAAQSIADAKAAGRITQSDGSPVPDGPPFVYRADAWWLENLASTNGDAMVNQNNGRDGLATESELLNDTTTEWTEWLEGMKDAGLQKTVAYSATFDAYLSMATQSSSMLIETSTAATTVDALITGSLKAEDIGADAGTDLSGLAFPDLDVGVGQLPGIEGAGSGQIGGNAWYLIGAGRSPEQIAAAWDYLKWVNETPQQVLWTTQGGYLPVFSNAEEAPEMQAYFSDTRPGSWSATALESLKNVNPDFPGPVIGPFKEFRTAVRAALEESLIGDAPMDETFAAANDEFQAALDTYAEEVGG